MNNMDCDVRADIGEKSIINYNPFQETKPDEIVDDKKLKGRLQDILPPEQMEKLKSIRKETIFPMKATIVIEEINKNPRAFIFFPYDHISVKKIKSYQKQLPKNFKKNMRTNRLRLKQIAGFLLGDTCKNFIQSKTLADAEKEAGKLRGEYTQEQIAKMVFLKAEKREPTKIMSDYKDNVWIKIPYAGVFSLSDLCRGAKLEEKIIEIMPEIKKNYEIIPEIKEVVKKLEENWPSEKFVKSTVSRIIYKLETYVTGIILKLFEEKKSTDIDMELIKNELKKNNIEIRGRKEEIVYPKSKKYITTKQLISLISSAQKRHKNPSKNK